MSDDLEACLLRLAERLVDQQRAKLIVAPSQPGSGYWFGGGNLTQGADGRWYLVGRYRDAGDSRTGLKSGPRGREMTILVADERLGPFEPLVRWQKSDLDQPGRQVLSIEGSALHWNGDGVELFVSSEKAGIGYPPGFESFLKPGTGVWTIERLAAPDVSALVDAPRETVLQSSAPDHLHVKDPAVYTTTRGDLMLLICTHPFSWSSSNSGLTVRRHGSQHWTPPEFDFLPRGAAWDVAITRATALVDVPPLGRLADHQVTLLFYDGGESLRNLDEHQQAVRRPRGYSCEELGGVAYFVDQRWNEPFRLSRYLPALVSPHGTGCSRYVDVYRDEQGLTATWQQAQPDGSQPLVGHCLPLAELQQILSGELG